MEHTNADQVREALLLDEELRAEVELYVDPEVIDASLMGKYSDPDLGWEAITVTGIFAASLGVQPEVRANRLVRPVVLLRSPAVN